MNQKTSHYRTFKTILTFAVMLHLFCLTIAKADDKHTDGILLLEKPAANWQKEAFPLGNGRLGIPFQDSLQEANVTLTKMQDGQRESLILGNGDLYGIVWIKDNGLFMRITKNDIWDARVDTSKDGGLPRVDIINNKISGPKGAPPSYKHPFPQPRCAAALRLGPVPKAMSAHLDIRKASVSVNSAGRPNTTLRILHDRNVLLVKSPNAVALEEIKAKTLPDATLGSSDGVSWMLMKMPGDIDYKGMDYALTVATKGDLKAISLVTSFDIKTGEVLKHAIALANNTIAEQEKTLISEHEQAWQEYWSRSGLQLEDKVLQCWCPSEKPRPMGIRDSEPMKSMKR